ncbi:intercellular adhesion molecule 3 [Bufo bufo]|uniref:intercellular adhesion molecule 3 n=1 Tax=Bufo bufo TaxID=8384 RepID=UPI001ABE5E17|nr:intercellular adhesion molecule 3 [Bufo bufo]
MKTCQILLALCTVMLVTQVRSQDTLGFGATSSELFVPLGEAVWLNCSTHKPDRTFYDTRLYKNQTKRGPNWLAVEVIVRDWENSTCVCMLDTGDQQLISHTQVMAYALLSDVTIDLQTELQEGKEYTINCTVHEVAPLEYLTINIHRGGDVIDTKSYEGPHVVNRRTVSHLHTFTARRSDNLKDFSCQAIQRLGSEVHTFNSTEITVQTYTLPEDPVINIKKWIENGTSFTAECLIANGFPPQNISLRMVFEDTLLNVIPVMTNEGTIKSTTQLSANFSDLGHKTIRCEAHLFILSMESRVDVNIYELPTVDLSLSKNTVYHEENVTATCQSTNKVPGAYSLTISVDGKEEKTGQTSVTHTFTASQRTPSLPITCTAYITKNANISQSSIQALEVHYPPEFSETLCPSSLLLVEGKTPFSCEADGNPRPRVNCEADGRSITDAVTVTRDMSGYYRCTAMNLGGGTLKPVSVTVQYPPTNPNVTVSTNETIGLGNPLNMTCSSEGLPAPTYTWLVPENADVTYSLDKSSVIIHRAAETHAGTYTCVVRNAHGEVEAKQEVKIAPDDFTTRLIIGILCGVAALLLLAGIVMLGRYIGWKNGRKGFYALWRKNPDPRQQNGNIPEPPANSTSCV